MLQKQTYYPKGTELDRDWVLVDLDGAILGRAATRIANLLRGRHKAIFTPHKDQGDFVVAVNADKIKLSGDKLQKKVYRRHSGHRGGLKETLAADLLEKDPGEMLRLAVNGMLPKNKLRKHLLKKLKVYQGAEHPHAAQQPRTVSLNDKEVVKVVKKAPAKKAVAKETATEPKPVKKTAAKPAPAKKTVAKPATAKAKSSAAKKPAAKKTSAKQAATKKKD